VSLRALDTDRVSLQELAPLTALERLTLHSPKYRVGSTCDPGMLQCLTSLNLARDASAAELRTFASCTGLRELSLSGGA
jgi:hypothetical protein